MAPAAVPAEDADWAYLSSGTWSLLGVERSTPITSREALNANWTNEGGYNGTFRFLKNITGLWIIQDIARNLGGRYSFLSNSLPVLIDAVGGFSAMSNEIGPESEPNRVSEVESVDAGLAVTYFLRAGELRVGSRMRRSGSTSGR